MKGKADRMKWYKAVLFILLFVLMIPDLIVLFIKERVAKNKRKKTATKKLQDIAAEFSSLLEFLEPTVPVSDEVFILRIGEFSCVQCKTFNGLSGKSYVCQLISSENPKCKEQVLSFLKNHPIENLLHGDINSSGFVMDHWEIRFIFEDRNLNRRICGYGVTELSAPYLHTLVPIIRNQTSEFMLPYELSKVEHI